MLTTFANRLDPDQARQNVGLDLDLNCLTLRLDYRKNFSKKLILKKKQTKKKHEKLPSRQSVNIRRSPLFTRNVSKKVAFEKYQQTTKKHAKLPSRQRVNLLRPDFISDSGL